MSTWLFDPRCAIIRLGCGGVGYHLRRRMELAGRHIAVTAVAQARLASTKEQRFVVNAIRLRSLIQEHLEPCDRKLCKEWVVVCGIGLMVSGRGLVYQPLDRVSASSAEEMLSHLWRGRGILTSREC